MMRPFDATQPVPPGVTLLEASAGTGKTYSITSIVLRLVVEEGMSLEQLLVVTYTEAATAELRDRVRRRLREALDAYARPDASSDDEVIASLLLASCAAGTLDEDRRRLCAALEEYDRAAISTIHGFCARVLREHAFECGAEFEAELLEDASELLDEIVDDFWARTVATLPGALVQALVEAELCVKNFRVLASKVAEDPELELVPEAPGGEGASPFDGAHARHRAAVADAKSAWRGSGGAVEDVITAAVKQKVLRGGKWASNHRARWIEAMCGWAEGADASPPALAFDRFTRAKVLESAAEGREAEIPSHETFTVCDALADAESQLKAAVADEQLILDHALAAYVREELVRRKRARRVQTFGDLLRLVRDALHDDDHGDALAEALRTRYRVALIDEFQDTDSVQWEIFRRIFDVDGHRLVLIGDPKQSIYGFRGADLRTYIRARVSARESEYGLTTNRRSDRGLVAAVNHLFGARPRPFADADIAYPTVQAHHGDRLVDPGKGAPLQFHLLLRKAAGDGATTKSITKGVAQRDVCRLVAVDIVRTLRGGITIPNADGHPRPVTPRDCAVLVRGHHHARDVQEALRRVGVPSVLRGASSVFLSRECAELEAVMRAVLEPSNIRLARAALATDLLGLTLAGESGGDAAGDDDRPTGIGDALARLDEDERTLERWLDRIAAWSRTWEERGVMPMLRALMDDLSLPARLLALHDGERRLTNLRHLGELLHDAAVARALDGAALLAWMVRQRVRSDVREEVRQLRLESDDDAVQVVTVHSSKGLEYPLVWCPYLWDGKLTSRDDSRYVRVNAEVDGERVRRLDIAEQHEQRAANEAQRDSERFAEGLRVLYVALTRARHRCVVHWGIVNDCGGAGLSHLLHADGSAADAAVALAAARGVESMDDATMQAALDEIARTSDGTISVAAADAAIDGRWTPPAADDRPLAARRRRRAAPLDTRWRGGSFTALTRGLPHRAERVDDAAEAEVPEAVADARVDANDGATGDAADDRLPLDDFPSSARAGLFVHEVLERHDFTRPAELAPRVRDALGAYGFDAARWSDVVTRALQAALETPLSIGDGSAAPLRLADIGPGDRLNELRFELPVAGGLGARGGGFTPNTLARALRDTPGGALPHDYADRITSLGFAELRGFLVGAIDLIVRHDGRWYVVDYKSNHLGGAPDDYAPERLATAMGAAHYVLQYHLYLLALHRYLAWRLPDYDYERDVGGVFYLFVRGMQPAWGSTRGVFADRPPLARIAALDALAAEVARV